MTLLPDPWWLPVVLAAAFLLDALISIRPPAAIRDCLNGVGLPREWWWVLIVVKLLAVAGLTIGIWVPGIGLASSVAAIVYFLCAVYAHLRSNYRGKELWINCLGMLALTIVVPLFAYAI